MKRTWLRYVAALLVCILFMAVDVWPAPPKFPDKPMEFVVQAGAGGTSDLFVRAIVKMIAEQKLMTVPITVNNKAGADGAIASNYLKNKGGSPYYLLHAASSFIDAPLRDPSVPGYKDVTPVARLVVDVTSAVVHADAPYKTVKDLAEAGKKKPGDINWGVTGIGGTNHMVGLKLEEASGAKFNFVPFTGTNEVAAALLGGHIQVCSIQPRIAMAHVKGGKMRILAVASDKRVSFAPDVPTFMEEGFKLVSYSARGFVAPPKISDDAKKSLSGIFEKLSQSSQWKEYVDRQGMDFGFLPADGFKRFLAEESDYREKVFKRLKVIK